MFKFLPALVGALALFFVSTTSASAAFTISGTPSTVDENGSFSVNINLSVSGQAGSTYYLRGAFSHSSSPTSYFGYTKNNAGNWVKIPTDYTQFYSVTLDSNASWAGTIEVKPDMATSAYKGAGNYDFKVGRYTVAGSGPTWSDNSTTIAITKTQTFTFSSGHNLVGLTVEPTVATNSSYLAEDFLRDLNGTFTPVIPVTSSVRRPPLGDKVIQITRWVGNYETHVFGSSFNNFPIVPGEGYFVRTKWRGTANISGTTSTLSSIIIPRSYSIVSFPRTLSGINNAEDLLQAMYLRGIDARQIFRFIGGFDVYGRGGWGIPFPITPGEGYFIRNFGAAGTFNLP